VRDTARTLIVAAALLALPGCFVTRPLGLGPDPGPNEVLDDDPPAVIYQKGQRLFAAEEWDDASDAFEEIWRNHADSDYAADAQFYDAESRYGGENFNGAFEIYKRHLQEHPLSAHAPLIQRRLWDMGKYLVQAGSEGYWGIFDYSDEGIEVLDYLSTAFPNGDMADWALIYAADHEWREGEYYRAIDHLMELLDTYPDSEWALEARLRLARAYRGVNRGQDYDSDTLRRSAAQYMAYIDLMSKDRDRAREYAGLLAEAQTELTEVRERLARKGLDAADFYMRSGRTSAAREELQGVVRDFPDTEAAVEARELLGTDGEEGSR
jgi:outer membrane protein assembly factor BamD (BamD/ComL family)